MNLGDYQGGRLLVGRNIQGPRLDAPMVDWPKNNSAEWRDLWFELLRFDDLERATAPLWDASWKRIRRGLRQQAGAS